MTGTSFPAAATDVHLAQGDDSAQEISPKQQQAVIAMLTCPSLTQAAKRAKVSRSVLHGWMREPMFKTALQAAQGEALDRAVRRLVKLADKAIDTLESLLDDPASTGTIRLRAAQTCLSSLLSLRQSYEVEERLARLEEQLQ